MKYTDEAASKPTPRPDRIILTWTGDPATTQAVTWRTDMSPPKAWAQIAVAEDGPLFTKKAKDVEATTQVLKSDLNEAKYHTVQFTGLTPKTKYVYRVGDGENWSEWFHFQTTSDQPEPFSFVYFGDAQNDVRSMWSRIVREAHSDAPKAKFLLHAGDLINRANRDVEWGEWFSAGGWLNGMIPNVPTPGNHEYERDAVEKTKFGLSRHWRPQFALPEHGPEGLQETVYTFDIQGVRIVSLNSNEKHAEQVPWLEKVLANNPQKWTIVTYHHPIYSASKREDNAILQKYWQPVFDKYHVDLVLQGHDHSYARTDIRRTDNLPTGANVQDPQSGAVYVVSVSGPKMYPLGGHSFVKREAEDTQLYQIISIDGDSLKYEARTAKGTLYDGFTLKKRPGQQNELIEQIPNVPENRRTPKK
ncbi:MAG: metallophosphoesterase family protein [Planctomycetales bacterium]